MNNPSYILQRNNQTVINLRPIHERMGFTPAEFPSWFKDRIRKMNLTEGRDFEKFSENRHFQYAVPLKVALSILNTVSEAKAGPIKRELSHVITGVTPTEAQNTPVEGPKEVLPVSPPLEATKPATVPAIAPNITVPVYQIEGRAAVDGAGLYKLWNGPDERRLSGWLNYRIDKLGLVLGKHYVEYALPPSPGHRRGFVGYILSLDAAISIADSETKGKGKGLAASLIEYRKELAKLRLSGKGPLTDFIGMQPVNVTAFKTRDVQEDLSSDSFEVSGLGGGPELLTTQLGENSEDGLFTQNGNKSEEQQPGGAPAQVDEKPPVEINEPARPSSAELLVQFAQLVLQQSQLLADHERRLCETQKTTGQIVAIGQQSALQYLGLSTGPEQPPQQTMRSRIRQIVNQRARKTGEPQDSVYAFIYNRLYYLYGISVASYNKPKDESYLELCERIGALEKVYTIVTSHEFTVAMNEAPVQARSEAA